MSDALEIKVKQSIDSNVEDMVDPKPLIPNPEPSLD